MEVARLGSFSKAAEKLDLSTSSVSRQVTDFEQWLGASVFQRTTRRVSLTNAGELFLERMQDIAVSIQSLRDEADALVATPRGRLRITAAPFFTRICITPQLPAFLKRYPEVSIEFDLSDASKDIIGEGIDLAIRIANLSDSSLVARQIGEATAVLTASPKFLKQHGVPKTVADLTQLPCLIDTIPGHRHRWPIGPGVGVKGPVSVNSGEIVRDLTLAGLGVSYLPDFFVADDLKKGRLVRVLGDLEQSSIGIYAVFPPRRQIGSAARAFVDHLVVNSIRPC
jgi:DNA-binding transcriptional LysR family regulator